MEKVKREITLKGLSDEMAKYTRDCIWSDKNMVSLTKKYDNKWIAVKDEKVVGSNADFDRLLQHLKKRGFDANTTVTMWISSTPINLILELEAARR